jgi:cbb3-type cytochrome oxidase subunit 3
MYKSRTPPKFDWFLSVKTYHYQYPIWSMLSLTVFVMFLFGYIVYIFERYEASEFKKSNYGMNILLKREFFFLITVAQEGEKDRLRDISRIGIFRAYLCVTFS